MNFRSPRARRGLAAVHPPPPEDSSPHAQYPQEILPQSFITKRKTRGNAVLSLPSLQGRFVSDSWSSFAGTSEQQHDLNGKCVPASSEKHIYDEEVWRACLFTRG